MIGKHRLSGGHLWNLAGCGCGLCLGLAGFLVTRTGRIGVTPEALRSHWLVRSRLPSASSGSSRSKGQSANRKGGPRLLLYYTPKCRLSGMAYQCRSGDFSRNAALSQLEFPLNVGAGAFLASQMPTGPVGAGPANLRLDGKEAAYVASADRYDHNCHCDHGYHPHQAEVAEVKDKPRIGKPVRGSFYTIHQNPAFPVWHPRPR